MQSNREERQAWSLLDTPAWHITGSSSLLSAPSLSPTQSQAKECPGDLGNTRPGHDAGCPEDSSASCL